MTMVNKTQPTKQTIAEYLSQITDVQKQKDAKNLIHLMEETSGEKPILWGSMVGFGKYHYKYESGREGDWARVAFAMRKTNITVYIMCGFDEMKSELAKLGKHKISTGSCLQFKKLADIDTKILKVIIQKNLDWMAKKYPS